MSGFTVFAGIAGWVLVLASLWIVYTKASEPGWATLVPFFNLYVLMRIVGRPGWWVVLYFVPLVNIVIYIIVTADLAHSFGKGDGFAVGLLLLAFIFYPLLARGDVTYEGPAASDGSVSRPGAYSRSAVPPIRPA